MRKTRRKETALDWAKKNQGCKQALAWLRKQGPITMTETYRRCPNVAWMWHALFLVVRVYGYPSRLKDSRKIRLAAAMEAFRREFWATNSKVAVLGLQLSCADNFLDKKQLQYWADRLREYVVPRKNGVSRCVKG
jgi:hypothetical protein